MSKESALWRQSCSLLYKSGISLSTGGRVVVGGVEATHRYVCVFVCALFLEGKKHRKNCDHYYREGLYTEILLFFYICATMRPVEYIVQFNSVSWYLEVLQILFT